MEELKSTLSVDTGPVEHEIGYAFPTSDHATSLGYGASGCFTIEVAGTLTAAKTYSEAKSAVAKLGTTPGWKSWDHPSNTRFYPHHMHSDGQPLLCANA